MCKPRAKYWLYHKNHRGHPKDVGIWTGRGVKIDFKVAMDKIHIGETCRHFLWMVKHEYRNETPRVLRPHSVKNIKGEKGSLQIQLVPQCVRHKIQTTT